MIVGRVSHPRPGGTIVAAAIILISLGQPYGMDGSRGQLEPPLLRQATSVD